MNDTNKAAMAMTGICRFCGQAIRRDTFDIWRDNVGFPNEACNQAPAPLGQQLHSPESSSSARQSPLGTCADLPNTLHAKGICENCDMWEPAQPISLETQREPEKTNCGHLNLQGDGYGNYFCLECKQQQHYTFVAAPLTDTPKRPTHTRKALFNQLKYPAGRADAYMDYLESRVSQPESVAPATKKAIRFCPFCGGEVWGEGCNLIKGTDYFSHIDSSNNLSCCGEFEIEARLTAPAHKEQR